MLAWLRCNMIKTGKWLLMYYVVTNFTTYVKDQFVYLIYSRSFKNALPSSVKRSSRIRPRCFWDKIWDALLLSNVSLECTALITLQLNATSWPCLLRSGLKRIFRQCTQLFIFSRSAFNLLIKLLWLRTMENKDLSSANSFTFDEKPCDKSLI